MSPRAVKVTITLLIVAVLLAIVYVEVPKVGTGHRQINTAGKIVYLSDADVQGNAHVWIISQDGSGNKDLTPGSQTCADPTFSPDGSQITYVSDKQGPEQVFVMDADGLHPHALTIGSESKSSPQFSPDGHSLAYIDQGTLTTVDLQSQNTTPLLPTPEAATNNTASAPVDISHAAVISYAWSPNMPDSNNGPEIAAIQEEVGVPGIPDEDVLTLLTSTDATPIELIAAPSLSFSWAPDGSKLYVAVLGSHLGPQQQPFSGIVAFTANGKPAPSQPIASSPSLAIGPTDPHISPDGKQVLFSVVNNPDLAHNTVLGAFIQPIDGSSVPRPIIQGPAINLLWSPDGMHLLLLLPRSGKPGHDLWVGPLNESSTPINLTNGSGDITSAKWSPLVSKSS